MQQLLEGLRVLELSNNVAGPFTGKLLAEYGADVIKIEPLEGDSARHQGPYKDDIPNMCISFSTACLATSSGV